MRILLSLLFIGIVMMTACEEKSEYHRLITSELATGERHDSLFLGIEFGMRSKQFFTYCWEQHKAGVLNNSSTNMDVRYELTAFHPKLAVDFYPSFYNDQIWKVPMSFYFDDYSEWNKDLGADTLAYYSMKVVNEWFDEEFIEIKRETILGDKIYKIAAKGNRKIVILPSESNGFKIEIINALVEPEAQKSLRKLSNDPNRKGK